MEVFFCLNHLPSWALDKCPVYTAPTFGSSQMDLPYTVPQMAGDRCAMHQLPLL